QLREVIEDLLHPVVELEIEAVDDLLVVDPARDPLALRAAEVDGPLVAAGRSPIGRVDEPRLAFGADVELGDGAAGLARVAADPQGPEQPLEPYRRQKPPVRVLLGLHRLGYRRAVGRALAVGREWTYTGRPWSSATERSRPRSRPEGWYSTPSTPI